MSIQESSAIAREHLDIGASYEPPSGELEIQIAKFFAEAFSVDRVGANDDFFDLGGDSLLGESLATSISRHIGREFEISLLVKHSTPRKIAALLQKEGTASPAQHERPPVFMVHGLRGFMLPRPEFLEGLAPDQTLRMFELPGIRGGKEPCTTIEAIAAAYVQQVEAEHPAGPVIIGGYCGGGIVALEMAAQFKEKGRPILHMILFDPGGIPPNVLDNLHRRRFGEDSGVVRRLELADTRSRFRRVGKRARLLLQLGRWTDGSRDEDIADERLRGIHERKYMRHMRRQRDNVKRRAYAQYNLSDLAQARFLAALHHYLPRRYDGPVDVFSSEAYRWKFEQETSAWADLLPQRRVHVLGDTHEAVINATAETGARLMQAVIDGALASPSVGK